MAAWRMDRWRAALAVFERILDLTAVEQHAVLALLQSHDPRLAADVATLLEAYRRVRASHFLEGHPFPPPPTHH